MKKYKLVVMIMITSLVYSSMAAEFEKDQKKTWKSWFSTAGDCWKCGEGTWRFTGTTSKENEMPINEMMKIVYRCWNCIGDVAGLPCPKKFDPGWAAWGEIALECQTCVNEIMGVLRSENEFRMYLENIKRNKDLQRECGKCGKEAVIHAVSIMAGPSGILIRIPIEILFEVLDLK